MRCPTRAPGSARAGAAASALRDEMRRRHAVAVGEDVDVSGLEGLEFGEAGGPEGGRDPGRRHRSAATPCPAHRRAGAPARKAASKSPARTAAMRIGVTFCRPDQAGMLLTSSTVGRPSSPQMRSTPAKSAPTAAAARTARSRISASARRHRPAALLHIGDPGRRVPHHGGDDAALRHEHAEIAEAAAFGPRHEALEVVDAGDLGRRGQVFRRPDQAQASPLRAEQRLEHERTVRASRRTISPRLRAARSPRSRASGCRRARAESSSSTCRRSARSRAHRSTP